jgi:ABC-type branched-subunit amino acid transport system substrate-binding protein
LVAGVSSGGALASGTTKAASHTPIIVGGLAPLSDPYFALPEVKPGEQAAIDSINAAGGVNGHPLKLDFCNTQLEPALELSCTRQLIADHVVAALDPVILLDTSGAEIQLLSKAHIAWFGGSGVGTFELSSSDSYPIASGLPGWSYGAVNVLKRYGATKVAVFAINTPSDVAGATVSQAAVTHLGLQFAGSVFGDPTTDPTLSSAAAQIVADNPNGVILQPTNLPLMVEALLGAGYKGLMSTSSSLVTQAAITALGNQANGILVSSQTDFGTDTANPAVAQFAKNMYKYEPTAAVDSNSMAGYAAAELFAKVAATSTAKKVTGKAFIAAIHALSKPISIGLVGRWSYKGLKPELSAYPRIVNATIAYGVVTDGKLVSDGSGFSDPFKP